MRFVAAGALSTLVLFAAPAAAAPSRGCLQGQTVLRTDEMRVFHSARRHDHRYYACLHDRPPIQSMIWDQKPVQRIAAAGHFFAYAWRLYPTLRATVVVRNARFNRLIFLRYYGFAPPVDNYPADPRERSLGALDLLVTRRGRVAWIEGTRMPSGRLRCEIYTTRIPRRPWSRMFDPVTDLDIVDWGFGIRPDSLRLEGKRVTWIKRGRRHSASLR